MWDGTIFVLCVWLISFSIMSLGFILVVTCIQTPFLFKECSIVLTCALSPHPSVGGHLFYFHLLTTVNNAVMNMGAHVSVPVPVFSSLGYISRNGIAESCSRSMFNLLENCQATFHSDYTVLHSHMVG